MEWFEILKINQDDGKRFYRICSTHFEDNCLYRISGRTYLKDDAIPTLHLGDDKDGNLKENLPK